MVKEGISLYLVQKVLGHSTIQVTERYSHLAPDQLQLAANAINKSTMEYKEEKIIPFKKKA
jgi:site-specific recombinase XerD